ncbi:phosphatase [Anoxynatronum sibiricum]|uniref:Phosphatase n=1 Tax=Anoxynatronum sibiricum TaxID=210623 RepID=A0ABU9VY54_9CLOT
MFFETDTHCHTLSSGHAYSTIGEMAAYAAERGLKLIAMTDHAPAMPDAPGTTHFRNLRILPKTLSGVEILKGAEVNILSHEGDLDLPDSVLSDLDLVIASLHLPCIKPGSREENTQALIKAVANPHVHVLGHIGNPLFPIHAETVVKAVHAFRKLIEINNSSLQPHSFRKGSLENCRKILELCRDMNQPVVLGSDAHGAWDVGRFDKAEILIEELQVPEELVLSTSVRRLKHYLSTGECLPSERR